MRKWVFIFLMFPLLASAELRMKSITGPWGLVTSKGDFNTEPWELRLAHNVNLSRNGIGTFSPRLGSIEIYRFPGTDSIIGLHTMSFRDGTERMIAAVDSAGVGYANIYASQIDSDQFGAKIDSTIITYQIQAYQDYLDTISFPFSDSIEYTHYFTINGGTDTIGTIVDTVKDTIEFRFGVDTLVKRINADATLNTYITADTFTTALNNDSAYFFKNDKSDTTVVWFYEIGEFGFGGKPQDTLFIKETFNITGITPTRLTTHWGVQRPTDFDQLNDRLYAVNGQQKGIIWNGDYTANWPTNAPGEPSFIPIAESGNLDGEYRYVLTYKIDTASSDYTDSYGGYVSPPIRIKDGQILIKDFPMPATQVATDSVEVKIYRTRANPGQITESDYAFLQSTQGKIFDEGDSVFNWLVTDNTADASLSGTDSIQLLEADGVARSNDSGNGTIGLRFGSPVLTGSDSIPGTTYGIFEGAGTTNVGVAYIIAFVDTSNNILSDSSRPLIIFRDSVRGGNLNLEDKYTMALPIAHNSNRIRKNIYRARVFTVSWDTLQEIERAVDTSFFGRLSEKGREALDKIDTIIYKLPFAIVRLKAAQTPILEGDTVISTYTFLTQLDDTVHFFTDSIPFDSSKTQSVRFVSHSIPPHLEQIVVDGGRVFGKVGSDIWFSRIALLSEWELFDFARFEPDDGDQINMMLPFKGGLLVGKSFKAFNWTDINSKVIEITGVPGCVAAKSAIQANGSNYYVTNRGVMALSEGAALLRYHQSELLSRPLNNFLKLPFDNLTKAVGAYVPQTEQLWWCIGDTTYVYDYEADKWATSSLTFGGTTLWDTDTAQEFRPGRSLYFYEQSDSIIYRFGQGHHVKGSGIFVNMEVESGPIFKDAIKQQIFNFAIWAQPETTFTLAAVNFLNEDDVLTGNWITPRIDRRVSYKDMYNNPAIYYRFTMKSLVAGFPMTNSGIDRIDIWYDDVSEPFWE